MSRGWTWNDAERALEGLSDDDLRVVGLLAKLPLVWPDVIRRLEGCEQPWGLYDRLHRFARIRLVDSVRVQVWQDFAPRTLYLTDLGLATVALWQRVDVAHLAIVNRLRQRDLLAEMPGLPYLAACYELLGGLAASRTGLPNLMAWERPWRARYRSVRSGSVRTASMPAYAALSWGQGIAEYLLLPDLGHTPPLSYRGTLSQMLRYRNSQDGNVPLIIVATTSHIRLAAWGNVLNELAESRGEAPLCCSVVTWADASAGFPSLDKRSTTSCLSGKHNHLVAIKPDRREASNRRLPQLVGALSLESNEPRSASEPPGAAAAKLCAEDRKLLDVLGCHPFLPTENLAIVLGCSRERAARMRSKLLNLGLARLVPGEEVGEMADLGLAELTHAGLKVLAAQQGLTLAEAVRWNGLTGGGPDAPVGNRRALLRNLDHTIGADEVFVRLYQLAARFADRLGNCKVVEWRNAAACALRGMRPDGYGLYRHSGELYQFVLEYDRGSMQRRDLRDKFNAYYWYLESGLFRKRYAAFPTVLMVTRDPFAEERIASALRSTGAGREPKLPVLITTTGRMQADPDSLLGPIWREPDKDARRYWLNDPKARLLQRRVHRSSNPAVMYSTR